MKKTALLSVLIACMFCCGAARARPRDAVMSQSFGCAVIGDSRQWLDCFYGAAQPARAALGLPPASAAQVRLATSPPAGSPADAGIRNAVMTGTFRCNDLADDRQWLDCYYSAAQPMRRQLGLSPAPQANVHPAGAAPLPAAETPAAQFGLSAPKKVEVPATADHVVARMTSYTFDHHGTFTVTLENGQVWRQLSGDANFAHWSKPAGNYVVTITSGWFGSFNLKVAGEAGLFKVRRRT